MAIYTCPGLTYNWTVTGRCAWRSVNTSVTPWTYGTGPAMKQAIITVFRGDCLSGGTSAAVTWSIDSYVTTNNSGDWSWSLSAVDLRKCAFAIGRYIVNPNYNPAGVGNDAFGIPYTWKFKKDPAYPEYACSDFLDVGANSYHQGFAYQHNNSATLADGSSRSAPDGSLVTCLMQCDVANPSTTSTDYFSYYEARSTSGVSDQPRVMCYATKGGLYYDVTDAFFNHVSGSNIAITDSNSGSGNVHSSTVGGTTQWVVPDNVDWYLINSVTITGAMDAATLTAYGVRYFIPITHPPANCSDRTSQFTGSPSALIGYQLSPGSTYFPTTEQANVNDRVAPLTLLIYLGDFSNPPMRSIASYKNIVAFAWISGINVKVAIYKGMQNGGGTFNITNFGFSTTQVGVLFGHDGLLFLFTDAQNMYSKDFGHTWNNTTAVSGGAIAVLGSDIGQGWTAATYVQGGIFKWGRYNGIIFDGGIIAGTNLYGGCVWTMDGWKLMAAQTGTSGNIIRPLSKNDLSDITAITGLAGIPVGMAKSHASSLVVLDYNTSTKRTKTAWSHDGGRSWQNSSAIIAAIPALDMPPAIIDLEDGTVAAVWQVSDVPSYRLSYDAGQTWV